MATNEDISTFACNECPGCSCEPEIEGVYRRNDIVVGYRCGCGVVVIDGVLQGVTY